MTASKNHMPTHMSSKGIIPQENGIGPPHFSNEKVSENQMGSSIHDNSILGELNNSLKQPTTKHNVPCTEKELKKQKLKDRLKARKMFKPAPG